MIGRDLTCKLQLFFVVTATTFTYDDGCHAMIGGRLVNEININEDIPMFEGET